MKQIGNSLFVLLIAALLLLSSCKKATEASSGQEPETAAAQKEGRDYITLLYSAADSFDPYQAKTDINRQLCRLLYEPLIKTDNEFRAVYSLAKTVKTEGKLCTVTLEDRVFSDGSKVTAEDVVYSFRLAKNSVSEYAYRLYEAESATLRDAATVVFSMTKADPYFMNLLDFPILKAGSEKRTDADGVALPPVGCGRYVANDERTVLTCNVKTLGKTYPIREIRLINAPDEESVSHYVEVNAADLYFNDISDGKIIRMSGNKEDINLNHLVFIAVNRNVDPLAAIELRQAISSGIDRQAVCRESYYNNAVPATGFYNPVFEPVSAVQNIEITANREITVANLERIGYNVSESSPAKNANGTQLHFRLLVNKDNKMRVAAANLIATQLKDCGIVIEVNALSAEECRTALTEGNFQLCLTEIALTPNMDLSELVAEGGSALFGAPQKEQEDEKEEESEKTETGAETQKDAEQPPEDQAPKLVQGIYTGENTFADAAQVLQYEMPLIPVCYRTGVLFYNEQIRNVERSSVSDMFFSIESYSIFTK